MVMASQEFDLVFNNGTAISDKNSIEHKIVKSLESLVTICTAAEKTARLASKIAFVIRFKFGAHITAAQITILIRNLDVHGYTLTIWAHLGPMQLQELFSVGPGYERDAIMDLEAVADRAVGKVMKLKGAEIQRKTPLMEELDNDIDNLVTGWD